MRLIEVHTVYVYKKRERERERKTVNPEDSLVRPNS